MAELKCKLEQLNFQIANSAKVKEEEKIQEVSYLFPILAYFKRSKYGIGS